MRLKRERYIRQTTLKGFGPESQEELSQAKVLVVGVGGLGVPVLQYLNAMGVGTLGMMDSDVVSLSNLHRQILYDEADIGTSKIAVALSKLKAQNGDAQLKGYDTFLTPDNALNIIEDYDLVVDASDNFPTRYLVNDACVILKKPFVYGALHGFEGHVSLFNHREGPTYRCLFPTIPQADEIPNCDEQGVLGVLPGIVGTLQALEAIKAITGLGTPLSGKLLIFNALDQEYHSFNIKPYPKNKTIAQLQERYELNCTVEIKSISPNDFETLLNAQDPQIIDVRSAEEYNDFHLPNTLHIPCKEVVSQKKCIDFDREVYFICQSGLRSAKAIEQLRPLVPKADLINVEGGMNELAFICRK